MVAPINYIQDVQSPFQAATQGLQFGAGIQQMQAAQQAQQLELQQKQQAMEAQQALSARLQSVMSNPNATLQDYNQLAAMMPKDRGELVLKAWDRLDAKQQKNRLSSTGQVLAALNSNSPEIAQELLAEEAAALRNSGDEAGAKAAETYAQLAKLNPAMARTNIGLLLSQIPGGDKVIEGVTKLGTERRAEEKAPFELSKAQSDAQKAAVGAKFAESEAVVDLQKKGWDITKIQEDIAINKQNARIAAANAATAREGNVLKREEMGLKLKEMQDKRDEMVRGKVADIEAARSGIDNALNTFDRLLKNPELDNVLGSVEGSAYYPSTAIALFRPGADADMRANALADIENVKSQAFVNNLLEAKAKGATFGSLTEKEGDRLIGYVRNLATKQGEKQFRENASEIQRLLLKSRTSLSKRYGVPESIPDTPQAASGAGDIDALLKKYGAK